MSAEVLILVATAVLAVVAICAAVVAVRAVRRLSQVPAPEPARASDVIAIRETDPDVLEPDVLEPESGVLEPRVVEGRLIVPPSQQQLVQTVLGRPGVRLTVFVHGAVYALRAESRDRITAMMRREYRRRRRERLQAGRRAVRAERPTTPSDQWLGS